MGTIFYQLHAISSECALLIRCRSFTSYPRMVTFLAIPTWLIRLGLCLWLTTTMSGPSTETGIICAIDMNYHLSAVMQYIKIATEFIILAFFLERVIMLHRSARHVESDIHHSQWRRLALINSGITFLVILCEVLVGQITVNMKDYLLLTYSVVNLIQANLVVFVVEDTRNVFRKRQTSSNNDTKGGPPAQVGGSIQHNGSGGGSSNPQPRSSYSYNQQAQSYSSRQGTQNATESSTQYGFSYPAPSSPRHQNMNSNGDSGPTPESWSPTSMYPSPSSVNSRYPIHVPAGYDLSLPERPISDLYDFGPKTEWGRHTPQDEEIQMTVPRHGHGARPL
ncbi:hypothetical protein BGW38_006652 [Lunasporangiospora selenospora]|uniref:Uncharacterized protein n=1 Tax=Lunasporangiospora selenospora TaxID=979761 RepID=A0A9P6KAP2_9FUNG|nr:hypothetical protein BGW38_006652 [Lunasporangiospora selenospora]